MIAPFSLGRLRLRSFRHHARVHLLLILSAATASAVVTGALLVGDSVQGSLAERAEESIGRIDHAVVGRGFFREEAARGLVSVEGVTSVAPILFLEGAIEEPDSRTRVGEVNVLGVDDSFWALDSDPSRAKGPAGFEGRRSVVNATLAARAGLRSECSVLVRLSKGGDVPSEQIFGHRARGGETLRFEVSSVIEDAGLGLFDLRTNQRAPANLYVPLATLQRLLERRGELNIILVAGTGRGGVSVSGSALLAGLRRSWTLEDAGLRLREDSARGYLALESRELILPDFVVEAAGTAARTAGLECTECSSYLANTIASPRASIPYSMVTAVGPWKSPDGRSTSPVLGSSDPPPGGIVLNEWAERELSAAPGDSITLRFWRVGAGHRLEEDSAVLRMLGTLPLEGVAADPGWTPEYPGVTSARSLKAWDPPFEVDLDRIRDVDEAYWDEHRATPKAFLALEDGRRLWASRFGSVSAVRFRPPGGGSVVESMAALRAALEDSLAQGPAFPAIRALRSEAAEAALGSTDFSGLYLGLSGFLIVSALVLVAMSFRLSAERRATELGLLGALGFRRSLLRRIFVFEGALLALAGSVLGLVAGIGYAAIILEGLRTWWRAATDAPFLRLHVGVGSAVVGCVSSAVLALAVVGFAARRLSALPPVRLLGGWARIEVPGRRRGGSGRRWTLAAVLASGGVGAVLLGRGGVAQVETSYLSGGMLLLVAGLVACAAGLVRGPAPNRTPSGLLALGLGYARRSPSRSLLVVALVASAVFVVLTTAGATSLGRRGPPSLRSGDGGFALVGKSTLALTASLGSPDGRAALGFTGEAEALAARARIVGLRRSSGDDASCLNLYRPRSPSLLGVGRDFIERGGFAWARTLASSAEEDANPWRMLEQREADGAIPAVADQGTATWILKVSLGDTLEVPLPDGGKARLRIVGLLSGSIFQGELLVGEAAFLEAIPRSDGPSFFLLVAASEDVPLLARALEDALEDYGFQARTSSEILEEFAGVARAYVATFQVLGALGILLGMVGLGGTMLRNVRERRGELALLGAVGFTPGALSVLVVGEAAGLLSLGLAIGAGSAVLPLVAILPAGGASVSWGGVGGSLVAVFAAGIGATVVALRRARREPIIRALRSE